MDEKLILKNNLKAMRQAKKLSQAQLAELVGVSRNTISSIETGQFNPTAKLALVLCIALDVKFEDLFYFWRAAFEWRTVIFLWLLWRHGQRQIHGEGRALVGLAFHLNVCLQQI